MRLTLVGSGERALRLEKRLRCAAAGLGLALELDMRKDFEVLGLSFDQTPAVLREGEVVFTGLPRTEEIEDWLRRLHSNTISLSSMTATPKGEQDHA